MKQNSEWKSTNYHQDFQEKDFIKLENGKYYEIGCKNLFQGDFVHQGILKFNDGFYDESGYPLRPSPSHAKLIVLTIPVGEYSR